MLVLMSANFVFFLRNELNQFTIIFKKPFQDLTPLHIQFSREKYCLYPFPRTVNKYMNSRLKINATILGFF